MNYNFTHITSSPHHPQGNGEAERAAQTIKNLLKKAQDPYIALLKYRTTPLQHGSSPSELLMSMKLRSRVPTFPSVHVPQKQDVEQFRKTNLQLRNQQKHYFDKRHRVRELVPLKEGQPVWIRTPHRPHKEAVVVQPQSPRSITVKTAQGNQQRNKLHICHRSDQPQPPQRVLHKRHPHSLKQRRSLPPLAARKTSQTYPRGPNAENQKGRPEEPCSERCLITHLPSSPETAQSSPSLAAESRHPRSWHYEHSNPMTIACRDQRVSFCIVLFNGHISKVLLHCPPSQICFDLF